MIDLYDTEILAMEKVLEALERSSEGAFVDRDAWTREVKERFAEIGLVVDVKWWRTNEAGVLAPDIEIVGRVSKDDEFDHARMAHEVQHDVLDLGEGGIIKAELPVDRKRIF